ncbi:MAG: hypothetical protein EPGJADBJ_00860 [Saprospiraceae bacterium]|nr:hypothetical protein [Saprospiraceae bacterium]
MLKSLAYFQNVKLPSSVAQLFKDLDVPLNLTGEVGVEIGDVLEKNNRPDFAEYVQDVYWVGQVDDNAFEGIQSGAMELTKIRGKNYDTILVFALEIQRESGLLPTRNQLFDLARAFNREFPYQPVVLVFHYSKHFTSIAVVERNDYKVKHLEGDKIGKMSLLRDVDTREGRTHAGHLRILRDMQIPRSGKNAVTTFETLYRYWQQALNVSVLNKKFYQELSNWYFWAIHHVRFPSEPQTADEETLKTHRANNVIRLITRLIFSWFLKEKKLVPAELFDLDELAAEHLKIPSLTLDRSEGSEYYLAILQNLFFATLNQEMNARRFKTEKTYQGKSDDFTIKNIYRHSALFKNAERAAELFKNIPFLNGGLFECLDDEKAIIDGFSETKAKQPSVPNFLFFQKNAAATDELNEDYGTKGKKYEVRGLINILNDYKFTIAENTPLEEEVALDPELLGRIFENLLASYNPETKTTARKQTGSFYTPREIVNYMVDESLIAYLKNKLTESHAGHLELGKNQVSLFGELPNKKGQILLETQPNASRWQGREEQLDQHLRLLFSQSDAQPFTDFRDVEDLIAALDQCKILDPACGSGAFPMGILHRMVALLHKLDPRNNRWRDRQIRNAEHIEDATARSEAIEAIKRAFQRNELDYGRKLFLIENCIYGVDIQPIAVQIAKLRFFISLICDQNADDAVENRGILSLPNLETKFVAANTLIGLDNVTLAKEAVADLLDERERLHHRMFSAKRYVDKKRFREKDEKLRFQIKDKLDSTGWVSGDQSNQLADWNPFDQNASALFFDPQWMFGIHDGFDVVIGNPPYMQLQKMEEDYKKNLEKQDYLTYSRLTDIYCIFFENGYKILKPGGVLTFITSNKWMRADYGLNIRKLLTEKTNPIQLIDFGMSLVFESATVLTNVLVFKKEANSHKTEMCRIQNDFTSDMSLRYYFDKNKTIITNLSENTWVAYTPNEFRIKSFVEKQGTPLGKWDLEIYRGILTGLNQAFYINSETRDIIIKEDPNSKDIIKPLVRGKDVSAWHINFEDIWIINAHNGVRSKGIPRINVERDYPAVFKWLSHFQNELEKRQDKGDHWTNLRNCAYIEEFSKPKIVYVELSKQLCFAYDESELVVDKTCFFISGNALKYLVAFLNSKLFRFCFKDNFSEILGETRVLSKVFFDKIPVKKISQEAENSFEQLVDLLLFHIATNNHFKVLFERVLDGMVCELYFGDLMREKEVDILGQVERDLVPFRTFITMSDSQKAEAIEQLHRLWTHPESQVRNRLALMPVRSPDVLGVILDGN